MTMIWSGLKITNLCVNKMKYISRTPRSTFCLDSCSINRDISTKLNGKTYTTLKFKPSQNVHLLRQGNERLANHITKNMKLFEFFMWCCIHHWPWYKFIPARNVFNSTYYCIAKHKLFSLECVKYSPYQKYSELNFVL